MGGTAEKTADEEEKELRDAFRVTYELTSSLRPTKLSSVFPKTKLSIETTVLTRAFAVKIMMGKNIRVHTRTSGGGEGTVMLCGRLYMNNLPKKPTVTSTTPE